MGAWLGNKALQPARELPDVPVSIEGVRPAGSTAFRGILIGLPLGLGLWAVILSLFYVL